MKETATINERTAAGQVWRLGKDFLCVIQVYVILFHSSSVQLSIAEAVLCLSGMLLMAQDGTW